MFARFGYPGTLILYATLSLLGMVLSCFLLESTEAEEEERAITRDEEYLSLINDQKEPMNMA